MAKTVLSAQGGLDTIPGQGIRSYRLQLSFMLQLKILLAATKIEDPPCCN